jgi:hypothetical protein
VLGAHWETHSDTDAALEKLGLARRYIIHLSETMGRYLITTTELLKISYILFNILKQEIIKFNIKLIVIDLILNMRVGTSSHKE